MDTDRSPHISTADVKRLVAALDDAQGEIRAGLMTRLAWRPAWAIRSRRGAIAVLREMFGRGAKQD